MATDRTDGTCRYCGETIRYYVQGDWQDWCLVDADAINRLWGSRKSLYVNVCREHVGGHDPQDGGTE